MINNNNMYFDISHLLHALQIHTRTVQQMGPPKITISKRQFMVGEKLLANCSTSKARPAPHITWLINGKKVTYIARRFIG